MISSTYSDPMQSVFVALILFIVGFVFVSLLKSTKNIYINKLFFFAFLVRIIFLYMVFYYLRDVGGDGFVFTDDRSYNAAGILIANSIKAGRDGYLLFSLEQNPGYFYLNGFLYSIFGYDTLSARILNAFLSSITAVLVFEIGRIVFDEKVAKVAGLLSAFMPNIIFLSVLQFKDAALIFVMIYTTYILISRNNRGITFFSIFAVVISLVVMWYLRKDYALPYIGIIILWLSLRYAGAENWIERMRKSGMSSVAAIVVTLIGSVLLIGLVNTSAGNVFVERYDTIAANNEQFVENASSSQIGFSRYLRIVTIPDLYKLPFSVAFTAILPMPAFSLIASPDQAGMALYSITNIFFILLLPFVILGFVQSKNISFANTIMIRWFPIAVLLGITIVFMGVLRYKEQLMPFFVIWASVAWCNRRKYKLPIISIYLVGFVGVMAAVIVANMFRN